MNSLKNYANYHGDMSGMDELIQQTASSALPPDGFHIVSVIQVTAIQAKEHARVGSGNIRNSICGGRSGRLWSRRATPISLHS